ncbi:BURP domain-containing protein 9-like isoform X1 [Triticum urartu]|uniref:BURP domain-containing protein n=2 Tax=Triticum urartu TaxID=4572 RepID=A0A8R7V052_TRIUA|nr:BURP domain-containing protein 9-like isoform X1 [Triticum urartu]
MMAMMSLLSSFLLVMAVWGGHHTNLASAEGIVISSSATALTEYWQTMVPNSPMPLAILELLLTSTGQDDHMGKQDTNNIHTPNKWTGEKYVGASLPKSRKIGLHPTIDANARTETDNQKNQIWFYGWGPRKINNEKTIKGLVREPVKDIYDKKKQVWFYGWGPLKSSDEKTRNELVREPIRKLYDKKNQIWFYGWGPQKMNNEKTMRGLVREPVKNIHNKKKQVWFYGWGQLNISDKKTRKELVREPVRKIYDKKNQIWFYGWGQVQNSNEKVAKQLVMEPVKQVYEEKNQFRGPQAKDDGARESGMQEDDGHQGGSRIHGESTVSNIIFFEESLKPGSTITPYIQPSATSGAPLLQREVANTIPMSTENFTDILAMFAPVSSAMADDVWVMLDLCERPSLVKGEKKTCATSVESMVEFAASVLTGGNTRGLRAFSSPDVPAEGVTSSRKYKVVAARRATESSKTMTCHGMSFPFVVFMCHAVNPTRTYEVTLESEDLTSRIVLLAVCHLDTSEFDPMKMPGHAKPGDAPACHFIPRDSVLWAPVAPAAAAAAA